MDLWRGQRLFLEVFLTFFLLFGLIFFPISALSDTFESSFGGSWKNSLYFDVDDSDDLIGFDSTISLSYQVGPGQTALTSESRFISNLNAGTDDGFRRQSFGIESRFGFFDLDSEIVFLPLKSRFEYWKNEASITFGGFTLEDTFLLEFTEGVFPYIDFPNAYGAGHQISISGETPGGLTAEVRSLFGMEENILEQEGIEAGSGYDIDFEIVQTVDGGVYFSHPLSSFHYVGTTAELSGMVFGCCKLNSITEFDRDEGFEYTLLEFTIESQDWPLLFNTDLKFTSEEKSVSIDPELDLDGVCFNLYSDFVLSNNSNMTELKLSGFGLKQAEVGRATISSLTSLSGNLWKDYGTNNIKLRAYDYIVNPTSSEYYQETSFSQVFSIEAGGQNDLGKIDAGIDFYFDMFGDSDWLSDLGLVTIHTKYELAKDLDLGTGISIEPESGMDLLVEADFYF